MDDIEAENELVIFQQDGAPPYYINHVRGTLDTCLKGGPAALAQYICYHQSQI